MCGRGDTGVIVVRHVALALSLYIPPQPMRIHVSEATAELLQGTNFIVEERGRVEVKVRD